MITRLAPTPSGFLHAGNAVNFLLVAWLAGQQDGEIVLRIDDMDAPRYRPAYVLDALDLLPWLGIEWQHGPRSLEEFESRFSMRHRTDHYWSELQEARGRGLEAYACSCSRATVAGPAVGGCPGGCRTAGRPLRAGASALRVHVPLGTQAAVDGACIDVAEEVGDFVVWRRDGLPAYHLASVIEDRDLGVTDIVRGADLRSSTAAQLFLAPYLAASGLMSARIVHHGLLTGPDGRKLSKSQLAAPHPIERTPGQRQFVEAAATRLGEPHGIRRPCAATR
jgi:glutamyl/glutaminyl-tRNA synthetase